MSMTDREICEYLVDKKGFCNMKIIDSTNCCINCPIGLKNNCPQDKALEVAKQWLKDNNCMATYEPTHTTLTYAKKSRTNLDVLHERVNTIQDDLIFQLDNENIAFADKENIGIGNDMVITNEMAREFRDWLTKMLEEV